MLCSRRNCTFRTDFLDASSLSGTKRVIDDYGDSSGNARAWADAANHDQLGDPVKGAAAIVTVATSADPCGCNWGPTVWPGSKQNSARWRLSSQPGGHSQSPQIMIGSPPCRPREGWRWSNRLERSCVSCARRFEMTIATELLQRHSQTLVDDNAQWQALIAEDMVWELTYAPAKGHPARLAGRADVVRHVTWFFA